MIGAGGAVYTRVLVTGAQGWLGVYTVAAVLAAWPEAQVTGLGRSPRVAGFTHGVRAGGRLHGRPLPPGLSEPGPRYRYYAADLETLIDLAPCCGGRPDLVIHLASGMPGHDPVVLARGCAGLTERVVRLAAGARLVVASSGSVYGPGIHGALREDQPCKPATPYARAKLEAERVAVAASGQDPLLLARIFNVVGPGQPTAFLVGSLALQLGAIAAGVQAPAMAVGPLSAVRDYLHVADVAQALVVLADRGPERGVINVASGRGVRVSEIWDGLLARAEAVGGPAVRQVALPGAPDDIPVQVADISRLLSTGIRPRHTLEDGLEGLLDDALALPWARWGAPGWNGLPEVLERGQ